MADAKIPCTYTLKDTKKESNWSYEDGTLHVKNRLASLRDDNGAAVGDSLVLNPTQKAALEALGWGGAKTCDDELKLKFPGTVTAYVQEHEEEMPPPPPRAARRKAPAPARPAKRFKQFRKVTPAPVAAAPDDDEPAAENKPFAFLAGRNYGVRPSAAPPPRPSGWAAAPPDAPVQTSRVVECCDGGFDDSWLGSDSDLSDDGGYGGYAAPREDWAAPPPVVDEWAAQPPVVDALPPAAAPVADDAEQAALIDAMLDGEADQPPARNFAAPPAPATPAPPPVPKPAPPVPPAPRAAPPVLKPTPPVPPVPKPPAPRFAAPPRRTPAPPPAADDDAFWAAAADAAAQAEAAAGAVVFEDASVTRERQRREPRAPPMTGEEKRQRAAVAADATYVEGVTADARRAHPTAAAARSKAGALRAASAAAAAQAPVLQRLGESSSDDDDVLGGPRTARKTPRRPGAALDDLAARTTATPIRRTDARAAADIAESWLAAQESSIQSAGARPKKTP